MRSHSSRAQNGRYRGKALRILSRPLGACAFASALAPTPVCAEEVELSASTSDEAPAAVARSPESEKTEALTREQVEAYLDSHALPKSPGLAGDGGAFAEVPPPPPRHRGLVVEASPGVYFPVGAMRHVSPPSPWLQVSVGYELAHWFMLLGHADLTIASTSYAAEPPPPRTYAQYGVGAAGRFQLTFNEWLAAHAQVELGMSEVTEDVLTVYGYDDADELGLFFGGRLGVEWLQVNPHLALALQGTVRNYPNLERALDDDPPLVVIGALALRYAF